MKISVKNKFKERIEASGIKKKHICSELNITPQWFAKLLKAEQIDIVTIVKVGSIIKYDFSADFPEIKKHKIYTLEQCQEELHKVLDVHLKLVYEYQDLKKKYKAIAKKYDIVTT